MDRLKLVNRFGMEGIMKQCRNCLHKIYKAVSMILIIAMTILIIDRPVEVEAKKRNTLTLAAAKSMGLANSDAYQLLQSKIQLSKVQYDQSVEALRLKEKNQKSFRWTPLLSFKFPEKADLSEAFEYQYKPLQLQAKIESLEHQLEDKVHEVYYNIESLYTKIYILQESIAYNEKRLEEFEKTLKKNKARLALGSASQNDIDALQNKIDAVNAQLSSDMSNFSAYKVKLSNLIGINVRNSYSFSSPLVDGEISRDKLTEMIEYTLAHNHEYYLAKVTTANALLALETNYSLMKNQYGLDMSLLDGYLNQVKKGEKINTANFKSKYQEFLKQIDSPWAGYKTILFISIPKEWFKGSIDGVRYVEDEPYVLYECALEYQDALKEQESVRKEIEDSITDAFENYATVRKTVKSIEDNISNKKTELEEAKMLNRLGNMTYEEYQAVADEYEEMQMDLMSSKGDLSEILFSLNRQTCGMVDRLLGSTTANVDIAEGGYSYAVENEGAGVYYYIHQLASENAFDFGLTVTEDCEVELTHFELWIDGVQIGQRTGLEATIRHLSLDLKGTERVFVRIYNEDEFVDDCDIDPSVYSAKLDITYDYEIVKPDDGIVGRYLVKTDSNGLLTLTIIPDIDENYSAYNIKTQDEKYLLSDRKVPLTEEFTYLGLVEADLDKLIITFYDDGGKVVYTAQFDTTDKTIKKITEITE